MAILVIIFDAYLREFCPDDFPIYLREQSGETTRCTLAELLPRSFGSANLAQSPQ